VKFADFELISRSRTVAGTVGNSGDLANVTAELLKTLFPMKKAVRRLGVSVSGFVDEDPAQTALQL
jgi:DNA polymerase-4